MPPSKPLNYATGYALICLDYEKDLWSILEVVSAGKAGKRHYRVHCVKKTFPVAANKLFELTKKYHESSSSDAKQTSFFG